MILLLWKPHGGRTHLSVLLTPPSSLLSLSSHLALAPLPVRLSSSPGRWWSSSSLAQRRWPVVELQLTRWPVAKLQLARPAALAARDGAAARLLDGGAPVRLPDGAGPRWSSSSPGGPRQSYSSLGRRRYLATELQLACPMLLARGRAPARPAASADPRGVAAHLPSSAARRSSGS